MLTRLPKLLEGYGKSLTEHSCVVVVVDLDGRDCRKFKQELCALLERCKPAPRTKFRIAIEETEAWLLGDRDAIKAAYPRLKTSALKNYQQDSICGTWEKLVAVIHKGRAKKLKKLGYPIIGQKKCEWAEKIAPHLDVEKNQSKSFQAFRDVVRELADLKTG